MAEELAEGTQGAVSSMTRSHVVELLLQREECKI